MNKTRKELIEIINRQLLATKPPFLRNSVYFSVSEATDLLRELEDENHYKGLLIKYINHVADIEGIDFLRDRDMFRSPYLKENEFKELQKLSQEDLPQPPKTEK